MVTNFSRKLLAVALLASSFSAVAALPQGKVPKSLILPVQGGLQVEQSFEAAGGLTGWVTKQQNEYGIVFTTKDGEYLLAGALIDSNGTNLTAEYAKKYFPKKAFPDNEVELKNSASFFTGASEKAAKQVVYAFFDPNCIYCHLFYKLTTLFETKGLRVAWVPVAYLKPSSVAKAATMLMAADPTKAFIENEINYNLKDHEGGIANAKDITQDIKLKLDANQKLMGKFGFKGTPAMAYKDASGNWIGQGGMISVKEMAKILDVPVPEVNDPQLKRFME